MPTDLVFEVKNLRRVDRGALKAFFTLTLPVKVGNLVDLLDINDMKLMENQNGELYAACPQQEYVVNGVKKWKNITFFKSRDQLSQVAAMASDLYYAGKKPESAGSSDIPW